ncbi:MAG TPA: DNA methyltransferase, partial [Candidatus Saccharimonadales bacterium]
NSAQVIHNQLTGELGMELLFIKYGDKTYLAQTVAIQDIDAYTERDRGRPKRDAFVGMLPPKLAQTIVNLGVGSLAADTDNIVLDPFCGTGVVLQEALLMGYGAYGTDLEQRMIDYSQTNLEWLNTIKAAEGRKFKESINLETGDATDHRWVHPFTVIACETYLGRPLSSWPNPEKLHEIMGTCNVIIQKFMRNLAGQIPSGTRLCLAVPAWQSPSGQLHHLRVISELDTLGYKRVVFSKFDENDMTYRRPGQLVGRDLLTLTKK